MQKSTPGGQEIQQPVLQNYKVLLASDKLLLKTLSLSDMKDSGCYYHNKSNTSMHLHMHQLCISPKTFYNIQTVGKLSWWGREVWCFIIAAHPSSISKTPYYHFTFVDATTYYWRSPTSTGTISFFTPLHPQNWFTILFIHYSMLT